MGRRRALVLRTEKSLLQGARAGLADRYDFIDVVEEGRPLAGDVIVAAFRPDAGVLGIIDAVMTRMPFSRVVATSESNVAFAAFLRSVYGLPGLQFDQAQLGTNKFRMKKAVRPVLPTADFWLSGDFLAKFGADIARCEARSVVLKPLSGSAGKGIHVLETAEAVRFIAASDELFIVESAVDIEEEFHCDGLVREGAVRWAVASVYKAPQLRGAGSNNGSLHLPSADPRSVAVLGAAGQVAAALGLADFVFHLELLKVGGTLLFGEIGLRPGGGGIAASALRFYGVNLWAEHLRVELGLPPGPIPERSADPRWQGVARLSAYAAAPSAAELLAVHGVVATAPGRRRHTGADETQSTSAFSQLAFFDCPAESGAHATFAAIDRLSAGLPA